MKLGKLPPREDRRTLLAEDYLDVEQLPTGPTDLRKAVKKWPLYANDRYGDCGPASCGHMVTGWTGTDGTAVVPSQAQILHFYGNISGFDPKTGANDVGVNMLDMLNLWRKVGFGGHKILGYMKVDMRNDRLVAAASYLFGGLSLGYALPEFVQGQERWFMQDAEGSGLSQEPNSWGGHAVNRVLHRPRSKANVSWGALYPVTREFDHTYSDEAYCVLSLDWVGEDRKAPNGFLLDKLQADLAKIR